MGWGVLNVQQFYPPPPLPSLFFLHLLCFLSFFYIFYSLTAFFHLLFLLSTTLPPFIFQPALLCPPPHRSNFSYSFSMRYSCDPPAVRCLALASLKSRSVLTLARKVGLPHSQFTRLPRAPTKEGEGVKYLYMCGVGGSRGSTGAQAGFRWA